MKPSAEKTPDGSASSPGAGRRYVPTSATTPAAPTRIPAPPTDTSIPLVVLLGVIVIVTTVRHIDSVPAPDVPVRTLNAATETDDTLSPPGQSEGETDNRKSGRLIDPNTAPWWELTAIPGIGEVTAKRIIEYRETAARQATPTAAGTATTVVSGKPIIVFRTPADLRAVHSIGPARAEAMATYLWFPDPETSP